MQSLTEDYLIHYGVRGQKWGVRRYQNSDGSLTSAGKKHVEKLGKRLDSTNAAISRNQQKIQKLRSYKNSKKNRKLEMKLQKKEIKRAKVSKLVNEARKNRELYDRGPTRRQKKALTKAYKYDNAIAKIKKKQNKYKLKVGKLEYKNTKKQEKARRISESINDYKSGKIDRRPTGRWR